VSVPSSATFMGWAGKTVPGSVAGVCTALDGYAAQKSIDALYIIYKECADWKKHNVSIMFSSTSERRKENAVNRVVSEVVADLNAAVPGLGDALIGYAIKRSGGAVGGKFATLGAGYSNERAGYVASGKTVAPISGSRVHTVASAENVNFGTLSLKEFETLGTDTELLKQHLNNRNVVRMYFLNKIQRLKLLVQCDKGNTAGPRWVDVSGNLMHSKKLDVDFLGEENACQMWAMDRYGNLFVDYDNQGYGRHVLQVKKDFGAAAIKARGQTNHSSFCAGREVICAGNIFFWKGQLLHIDNGSGHYAPNRQALYNAVSILWNEGAVLDYLRVAVMGGPNVDTKFYKGSTFLANGGADWRQQDWKADQDGIFRACPTFHY
jgi:hypothetical protein